MILNYYDPDGMVAEWRNHICPFHKIAPGEPYAGCTCSATYSTRKATPEEREQNRKAREARDAKRAEAYRLTGMFGCG